MRDWVVLHFNDREEWEDMFDRFENLGYKLLKGIDKNGWTITLCDGDYTIEKEWCA